MAERGQIKDLFALAELQAQKEAAIGTVREFLAVVKEAQSARIPLQDATKTKDVISGINGVSNATKEYDRILQKATDTVAQYNGQSKEIIANAKKIADAELVQAKAANQVAEANLKNAKAAKEAETANTAKTRASEAASKSEEREAKIAEQVSNDYLQLSKAYSEAALKAKNYALTLGESHPVTVAAVKDAKAMYDVLYRIDQTVGQNQRNVGNYKSAFDGLRVSFSQVSRELPSLTVSAQQFFLAISNNLPMVADEIAKAKVEIAALKEQGKEAPSVLSRIGEAMISWQVGLSIGITLLTAYGSKLVEWIGNLLDGSAATKEAAKQQKILNDVQLESLAIQEKYRGLRTQDFGTFNRNLENQIAYLKAIGGNEEEIIKLEQKLIEQRQLLAQQDFVSTGGLQQLSDLGIALDKARSQLDEFIHTPTNIVGEEIKRDSDAFKARKEQLQANFDYQVKVYGDQKAIVEEFYNANKDAQVKAAELERLQLEKRQKFFGDDLQYRADKLKEYSQIEVLVYRGGATSRIEARKTAAELERNILAGEQADEIFKSRKHPEELLNIFKDYALKRKKLNDKLQEDLALIRAKALAYERETLEADTQLFKGESFIEKILSRDEKAFERRKQLILEDRDVHITAIEREKNAKLASAKSDEERQKIEEKFNKKRVLVELDADRQIVEAALEVAKTKLAFVDDPVKRAELEAKIAELKKQLEEFKGNIGKIKLEIDTTPARNKLEELGKDLQKIAGTLQGVFGVIGSAIGASVDRQKNALQDQIDLIEERKNKEIEAENASGDAAQVKADKIAVLNARAASQKEQLERRQRQLDQERARFEKIANIGRIAMETAIAVVRALADWTVPYPVRLGYAISAGVLGAAQLAVAIASPLPKFFKGKNVNDNYEGLGFVGDGGKKELHITENGAYVTPDKPTLTWVGKKDIILPDADSVINSLKYSAFKKLGREDRIAEGGYNTRAIENKLDVVTEAIKNKREVHFKGSHNAAIMLYKHAEQWTNYIKNQTDW